MGRAAYEATAGALPTADHPFAGIMNAARKVVFSRTVKTAEWANTTIAGGNTTEETDKLRRGDDGHIVIWGGVGLWRSLMRLDLIDEFRLDLHPYVAAEGTRLFDDVPKSYQLDLVSSTEFSSGPSGCSAAGTVRSPGRRNASHIDGSAWADGGDRGHCPTYPSLADESTAPVESYRAWPRC